MSLWKGLMSLCMVGLNCLFAVLVLRGCVCVRMFAVVFAFIFGNCVLPVLVCQPTQPER